jgi:hypothetical protein
MLSQYIVFDSVELSNFGRFKFYRDNGFGDTQLQIGDDCCVLPLNCDMPEDGIYVDPVTDDAPWYSPSVEESGLFGGFLATRVDGLDSVLKAESGDSVDGGYVGQPRRGLRTLTITGVLQAQSCCGLQYGADWLEQQLLGGDCSTIACDGATMFLYNCPPSKEDLDTLTDDEIMDKYLRAFYGCKLLGGVKILSTEGSCCGNNCGGMIAVIQFTIGVEKPGIYSKPLMLADGLQLGDDCFCALAQCSTCASAPTKIVEITTNKTRLPIRVKDDGSWCPIGWTFDEYNIDDGTNYLDVSEIDATRQPYYIRVNYDGSWSTIGWDATTDTDFCLLDVQIAQICSDPDAPTVQGCTSVSSLANRDLPIMLNVANSGGGSWSPVGWANNPADFPPDFSNLTLDLDCDKCFEAGTENTVIDVSSDGTWDFTQNFAHKDLWRFSTLDILGFEAGTYQKQIEVSVNELVPPCYENVEPIDISLPKVEDCYCEPPIYSQQCYTIDLSTTGKLNNNIVSQLTAISDLSNVSLEIFYFRYNNFPDPCSDDEASQNFWHCQTACAGWHAAKLYAGMVVDYDSALNDLSIHGGRFVSSKWLGLDGYASFGDCGYVVVRVKAQCEGFDTAGENGIPPILSFNVGVVSETGIGIN